MYFLTVSNDTIVYCKLMIGMECYHYYHWNLSKQFSLFPFLAATVGLWPKGSDKVWQCFMFIMVK